MADPGCHKLLLLTALYCVFYRQPRGLGFIEFYDERDAEEALRGMDRMDLGGREVSRGMLRYTDSSTPTVQKSVGQAHAGQGMTGQGACHPQTQQHSRLFMLFAAPGSRSMLRGVSRGLLCSRS